ncbi:hypothetical protein [Mesorhizobium sp. M1B.F.Ca.ET.045.04.1.1]|uniref:hypothetical protein n=1 Tax=Mesorhizobium sp. M1B.F.Ca.ET.045.04.1.1 TaxID=2493673 RepID=UPI000F75A1FC|nr:hypothetical protein [Mesorhizobium sp. M1B.F.Ca.ET.045.04.1.1]AZO32335.1 hypothetical protein EJ071_36650 [Mesorhizobium sp. M1B.F.Ca.ET.045.04.1.1]
MARTVHVRSASPASCAWEQPEHQRWQSANQRFNASVDAFTHQAFGGAANRAGRDPFGGSEGGSGTTLAQGGAAFNGSFGLDGGRVLQLGGSSTATGYIYLDLNAANPNTGTSDLGAGTLAIGSGTIFDDQSDGGLYIYANNWGPGDDGSAAAVNNAGTFVKSGAATTATIATRFNNTGLVDVESGTLSLSGGGIDVGATYQGAGTVNFSGGTRTLDAASSITGNATFSGGTTTVDGTVSAQFLSVISGTVTFGAATTTAAFSQSGGELNGSGLLTVTGLATLSGVAKAGPARRWRRAEPRSMAPSVSTAGECCSWAAAAPQQGTSISI